MATERPALAVRLRAWLLRARLDRRLVAGEQPWASSELQWRAAHLAALPRRRHLADELERVIESALAPARPTGAAVPLNRAGVIACSELIRELADELRAPGPINARGVVLVRWLLRDGGSALYVRDAERALETALWHARAALLLLD